MAHGDWRRSPLVVVCLVVGCSTSGGTSITLDSIPARSTTSTTSAPEEPRSSTSVRGAPDQDAEDVPEESIVIDLDAAPRPFDPRLLGTNVPAWLGPERLADPEFQRLTVELGTTVVRMPGGSWSNGYDWLACENGDADGCYWTWAARPSDFIDFMEATGTEGMWTLSGNTTAEEAAAAVAFFNGDVGDLRPIGVDVRGRDWRSVGDWAALRASHGHPEPTGIRLWEFGNEMYGAKPSAGPECASFGWEDVWTCDGGEYVEGVADHDGYLEIRDAMLHVDPSIEVGSVGVASLESWGNWGTEVIEAAGREMDFYVIHQYAFDGAPSIGHALETPRATWPIVMDELRSSFLGVDPATDVEFAVTEYNLVAYQEADQDQLMTRAVGMLFTAETIGQLALSGVSMANHWNLANGRADNGTDYGMIDSETYQRSPQYYGMAAWRDFGQEILSLSIGSQLAEISAYAGRAGDGTITLIVLNGTDSPITADVAIGAAGSEYRVAVDVVSAPSLDSTRVSVNAASEPSLEPGRSTPMEVGTVTGGLEGRFEPVSITTMRFEPKSGLSVRPSGDDG